MTASEDVCRTCGQTYGWHEENKPIHPFNDGQAGAAAFLGARRDRDTKRGEKSPQRGAEPPPRVVWPTDPVLRVALIRAGVITPEDLRSAEEELRTAMGDTLKGPQWSATVEESTDSSTKADRMSTRP